VNTLWSPQYPAAQVGVTLVVGLAALTGALAGVFYWGPKITGRPLGDGGGYLVALGMLIATIAVGPPYIAFGFATRSPGIDSSLRASRAIPLTGRVTAAIVVLLPLLMPPQGAPSRGPAADDPWGDGQTLEWATATPPVRGNFAALEDIVSPE